MIYKHTIDQSKLIFNQCLGFFEQHKIKPIPLNYSVTYEIFSGSNQELISAYNKLTSENSDINDFVLQDLYFNCIHGSKELELSFAEPLSQIINGTLTELGKSQESVTSYENKLLSSEKILLNQDKSSAQKLITALYSATKQFRKEQEHLKNKLIEAEQETKSLRANLAKLEEEATLDPLSGLLNRHGLDKKLTKITESIDLNTGFNITLLLFDIDHFKQVNDCYGHVFGDHVIKHVAKEIQSKVRGQDLCVRYGGEEFLVLLMDTDINGTQIVADKIRTAVKNLRWKNTKTGEQLPSVTISGGITKFKRQELPSQSLKVVVARADAALYRAKEAGRDQIRVEM
ncbi:diguanylate cyclase [Sessilibacter sp. MAH4]